MGKLSSAKFLRLLQTFGEEELKAFRLWLQSPWCNSNKNLNRLLDQLKAHHPHFAEAELSKEKLFRQVLPTGKYSARRMNNLLSEAYLAAEQFLVFQRFAREQNLRQELLAKEFQRRSLNDWFLKSAYCEIERLEHIKVKAWEDQVELFRQYRRLYHHPSQELRMETGSSIIDRMGEQLDLLYLLEKAGIINEMTTRNRLLQNEHHAVEEELKRWASASIGIQHPAIALYRLRFAGADEDQLAQYQALQAKLLDCIDQLDAKEQKLHLLSLLNDAMRLIKSGQLDITASLPLYQLGLQTGILLQEGKLSRNTYTTIVIASNTKGDFGFTQDFIERYAAYLDEAIREDCTCWASAHLAYWQGQLGVCLERLREHDFRAPYFQLISRVLSVQAYFDLYLQDDAYQVYLFAFFDTFERWLSREKIWSKANQAAFLRFVQKCRALAKCYGAADFNPQKVSALLEGEHNIQALNWLQQRQELVLRLRAS
jgi:hypothetical protein